jgi:signal transduction histidine kinase
MALNRDMRGVESEVLSQLESLAANAAPYEVSDEVTLAFARFPYPESFFTWSVGETPQGAVSVFSRMDRRPSWDSTGASAAEFLITVVRDPPEFLHIIPMLQSKASRDSRVVFLETRIGNETYQIVARPVYGGPSRAVLQRFAGFTVNLGWVRSHYFSELISQLSRVLTAHASVALTVLDDKGAIVTSDLASRQPKQKPLLPFRDQRFPLLFFDPVLRTSMPGEEVPIRYWTARAEAIEDKSLLVAADGAHRTFLLISIAALAATIAMILGIHSARASAQVAAMKSEFVSTVTHELKTPLSSIRLASETLVRGRYRSQEVITQYAELLLKDVSRLTRMVDNLLSITRLHDVHGFYTFESVDLPGVVEEALSRFQLQL